MAIKKTMGERAFAVFSYLLMGAIALIVLLPLLYIFQITFSTSADPSFRLLPKGFTLDHYRYVINNDLIVRPFLNSLSVTGVYVVVAMTLTICMAYPLSRHELVGRKFFNFIVVVPMLLSLGFLPKYLLVKDLGMLNTFASLVLPAALNTFNIVIMRNFFQSVPDSLVESARLDGCSEFRIMAQIIIPLSKAAIATVGLFYMVSAWNSYTDVMLYINDIDKHTLQVVLRTIVMEDSMSSSAADTTLMKNVQYTTIVIALVPIMVVYPFLQRYFVEGIMIGSVKG